MKTARRHELQTNELAARLARGIEAAKPYSRMAVGGLVLVVVLGLALAVSSGRSQARVAEGWQRLLEAQSFNDAARLEVVASEFAGTPAAVAALVELGNRELGEGAGRLLTEKAEAKASLRKAVEHFAAAAAAASEPQQQQAALYGQARAQESLGDLDKAVANYQTAVSVNPAGALAAAAQARLKDLQSIGTKRFYDNLAKYEPKKSFLDEPGLPGTRPADRLDDQGGLQPFGTVKPSGEDKPFTDFTLPRLDSESEDSSDPSKVRPDPAPEPGASEQPQPPAEAPATGTTGEPGPAPSGEGDTSEPRPEGPAETPGP
jgi:hypothetical protein